MKGKLAQAPSLVLVPLIRTTVPHLSLALTLALTLALVLALALTLALTLTLALALALALLEEESRHGSRPYVRNKCPALGRSAQHATLDLQPP